MRWYLVVMAAVFSLIFVGAVVGELLGWFVRTNPALLMISSGLLGAVTWVRVYLAYRSTREQEGT